MTDEELVKRLRPLSWSDIDARFGVPMDETMREAADRIEALTAERDEALNQLDSARHSVDVLEKRVAFVEDERRKTFQALLKVTKIHDEVEAKLAKAVEALRKLHHAVCGETGFAACVRLVSGLAYPWPALDEADEMTRTMLAEIEGEKG